MMNTLTTEQIKHILEGAPEGEEHVNFPICGGLTNQVHRLDDLREILTLRQRVEGLERDWNLEHYYRRAADEENEIFKAQQSEVAARAVEEAVRLYTHKWSNEEELNQVGIDILRKGVGYIYPRGLIEYANQLRKGEGNE